MSAEKEPRNINEHEIELIKGTFDEALLKSIRALFFGLEVADAEKTQIKSVFSNTELMAIMYKRFYPQLDKDTPIGQVQDTWLGVEQMISGMPEGAIYQAIHYKDMALQYTKQALELLADPTGKPVQMQYSPANYPNDTQGVILMARNQFIRHVEQQLLFLWLIAQQKTVVPEEKAKKNKKDSSQ